MMKRNGNPTSSSNYWPSDMVYAHVRQLKVRICYLITLDQDDVIDEKNRFKSAKKRVVNEKNICKFQEK